MTPGARAFAERHPTLFHVTDAGNAAGIARHGILSTSALLDLNGVHGQARARLERQQRRTCIPVGGALLRDQLPMPEGQLRRCLPPGFDPADWYALLNGKVFFWVSLRHLSRLGTAQAYRGTRQAIYACDTAAMLRRYGGTVRVCRINSGYAMRRPAPRGPESFVDLDGWASARPRWPVLEVTVEGAVSSLAEVCGHRLPD